VNTFCSPQDNANQWNVQLVSFGLKEAFYWFLQGVDDVKSWGE
jgi:hypothetical protein